MLWQEAVLRSPLRVLDRTLRGGLGAGHLGLILAPPGAGTSVCLAQLGLDALLRGRWVLHVALGQGVEHVSARYVAQFEALADEVRLAGRQDVGASAARRRLIRALAPATFGPAALDEALAAFEAHLGRSPTTVLVDGVRWPPSGADAIRALKARAGEAGAELWIAARAGTAGGEALRAAALTGPAAALVDVVLLLEPHGLRARLTLLKEYERSVEAHMPLVLEGDALHAAAGAEGEGVPADDPADFTLLAGGTPGAEEAFGACAERWGVGEVNYSFAGRQGVARTRGLIELSAEELRLGAVSPRYLAAHLHRPYPESAELQRVLQLIWHQVSHAGEVFAVGALREDGTASGGTGWAVELARHWGKPVHVFDQAREVWLRWDGSGWRAEELPVLREPCFTGAGTRRLAAAGRAAIEALFERTFGT